MGKKLVGAHVVIIEASRRLTTTAVPKTSQKCSSPPNLAARKALRDIHGPTTFSASVIYVISLFSFSQHETSLASGGGEGARWKKKLSFMLFHLMLLHFTGDFIYSTVNAILAL